MFARLYAILDTDLAGRRGLDPLELLGIWLDAGVGLVQLRAKTTGAGLFLDSATRAARMAAASGATLIVNDRADIAALSGASGVHVGQDDLSPGEVRRILPGGAVVGLSTHTDDQVRAALVQPVEYLAIGPVYETVSKANPDRVVGLEGVRRAVALAGGAPVVAIGGITLERVPDVLAAGAASVAVISDLLVGDPGLRAKAFLRAVSP